MNSTSVPGVNQCTCSNCDCSTVIAVGVVVPLVTITIIAVVLVAVLIAYKKRRARIAAEKNKFYMEVSINTTRMDIPDTEDDDFVMHKAMTFPNNTPSNMYEITNM